MSETTSRVQLEKKRKKDRDAVKNEYCRPKTAILGKADCKIGIRELEFQECSHTDQGGFLCLECL